MTDNHGATRPTGAGNGGTPPLGPTAPAAVMPAAPPPNHGATLETATVTAATPPAVAGPALDHGALMQEAGARVKDLRESLGDGNFDAHVTPTLRTLCPAMVMRDGVVNANRVPPGKIAAVLDYLRKVRALSGEEPVPDCAHEVSYTEQGLPVCSMCGAEMPGEALSAEEITRGPAYAS